MGRGRKAGWSKKQKKEAKDGAAEPAVDAEWLADPFAKENENFVRYYRDLCKIVPESEWDEFRATLSKRLPMAFRINAARSAAPVVLARLRQLVLEAKQAAAAVAAAPAAATVTAGAGGAGAGNDTPDGASDGVDATPPEPPCEMPWYPNSYGWQASLSTQEFKKHPLFKRLHQWLVVQTENGFVSRQEAVSMIPPLLLAPEPHHTVLDMCAAPGSKTAQLVEALHLREPKGVPPTGCVLANDVSGPRTRTLCNQVARLASPVCVVTQHNAREWPEIDIPSDALLAESATIMASSDNVLQSASTAWAEANPHLARSTAGDGDGSTRPGAGASAAHMASDAEDLELAEGTFDRVLCDVPCSGDGTIRKNVDAWLAWKPHLGLGLHRTQLAVASRGLLRLKIGGILVYSTCSLNPVENEAVVAALLTKFEGRLELVDMSSALPGLKRRPGMTTWPVVDKKMMVHTTPSPEHGVPETLFPPSPDVVKSMHLERCFRLLPHLQNTGGFFVATFRKLGPMNHSSALKRAVQLQRLGEAVLVASARQKREQKAAKAAARRKPQSQGGRAFASFLEVPATIKERIVDTYGLTDDFPLRNLYARSAKMKTLWLISDDVRRFMVANPSLTVQQFGVKAFVMSSRGTPSVAVEGAQQVMPFMRKRLMQASASDLVALLRSKGTNGDTVSNAAATFSDAFAATLQATGPGPAIVQLRLPAQDMAGRELDAEVGKFVAGTALVTAMVHTHGEGGGLGISVSMRKGHIATALACLGLAGLVDEHLESDSDDEPSRAVARKRVRGQGAGDGDAGDDASVDAACDAATAEASATAAQAEAATKKRRCGDVAGAEQ